MKLTREMITDPKRFEAYIPIPQVIANVIDGRICNRQQIPFLCVLADFMRIRFREVFHYLEIGTLFGGSMCAVRYHAHKSKIERYAGIDIFSYYGKKIEPKSKVEVSIERADRNIRYFGGEGFALFEGDSHDTKIANRALCYLRKTVHMLLIDGDHTAEGLETDFRMYAPAVAPGGIVVFDDYNVNGWPGVTAAVDRLNKTGWNDIGPIAVGKKPTIYVMEREGDDTEREGDTDDRNTPDQKA